jgi:PAS domain S-box-containing protein
VVAISIATGAGYLEVKVGAQLRALLELDRNVERLEKELLACESGITAYVMMSDRPSREPLVKCRASVEFKTSKIRELADLLGIAPANHGLEQAVEDLLSYFGTIVAAIDVGLGDELATLRGMEQNRHLMGAARKIIDALQDEHRKAIEAAYIYKDRLHAIEMITLLLLLATTIALQESARRSARHLRGQLALHEAIWQNSGDAMFLFDIDTGKIVDANPKGCALIGLARDQIIGRDWLTFIPDSFAEEAKATVSRIGREAQTQLPGLLRADNGQQILAEASISAEINMMGSRFAVSCFRDLGTREAALLDALLDTAFRKAIEQTLPIGLVAVSDEGTQTYVNDRFCAMTGWSRAELIGQRPPFVYWPPEELDHFQTVFREATAGAISPSGAEITLIRKSGERFPAQLFVSRIDYERSPGWLAFVIDVSERKHTEAALEQARRFEGIGQLAGQVAHDFNNILSVITINTAIARMSQRSDADLEESLAAMAEAAKRGTSITRSILAIARKQSLKPEPVELGVQLEELKPLLGATYGPTIAFTIEGPPEPVWISVDAGGLSGSLLNLVANSRDAMQSGGRAGILVLTKAIEASPQCTDKVLQRGSYAVIEVWDTGTGMPPDVKRRAFEPFFSTKGRVGTGLGLAAAYSFARQSGGTAEIETEPGRGTTVRLFLPIKSTPGRKPVRLSDNTPPAFRRILLVDDEPELLKGLATLLEAAGHIVTTAADGETALAILAKQDVDILLSDIVMPDMNGATLAEKVARRHPQVAIALMTGFGMRPPEETLPWEIVEKPFGPDVISALLSRLQSTKLKSCA